MVGVVVISHGAFCEGMMDTLKMISGDDFGVRHLSLVPGTSPEDFRSQLERIVSELEEEDPRGCVVLCDIAGGTPFNSAAYLSKTHKIGLVSGVNIPMLITLAIERTEEDTLEGLVEKATSPLATGIKAAGASNKGRRSRAKLSLDKD